MAGNPNTPTARRPDFKKSASKASSKHASKTGSKPTRIVKLFITPSKLREIFEPESSEEETPVEEVKDAIEIKEVVEAKEAKEKENNETKDVKDIKDTKEAADSPATSATLPPPSNSNGDNASDSNAATPAAEGTPAPTTMGPPTEGPKKKGIKRSAATANGSNDGIPKPRGKPGPKKKPRLEDGTIDHNNSANRAGGAHKLGPKANQGAINAGLRALDRSGKPCRRWAKGGFTLKSFTGVIWEIPRWTAPPKKAPESGTEGSAAASVDSSGKENKENKENGQEGNSVSNSNSGGDGDVEMGSVHGSIHPSSPAPMAITAT
ncbi:hypothetical protein G7046_g7488 [Stylonectria norvegica]|nr:hypothetical protein G7046_g7488 [Stylonectria norvegica]